jgi:hypothetical protein
MTGEESAGGGTMIGCGMEGEGTRGDSAVVGVEMGAMIGADGDDPSGAIRGTEGGPPRRGGWGSGGSESVAAGALSLLTSSSITELSARMRAEGERSR